MRCGGLVEESLRRWEKGVGLAGLDEVLGGMPTYGIKAFGEGGGEGERERG